MAFMKRDVNIGLLVLIIAAVIIFSSFSVYYQSTFKNVSLEYQNKLEQLGQITTELSKQEQELNQTYGLRVKAEEDKNTLDVKYTEVRDENEQLSSDNTNLRLEVASAKSELSEKTVQLEATQNLLASTQSELGSVKSKIANLNNEIDCLKKEAAKIDADEKTDSC